MAKKNPDEMSDYEKEVKAISENEHLFSEMLKTFRPELYVLGDMLDSTGINYYVIFQIIRHLNGLALGNKYGTVTAHVENGVVTFIKGEESTKINESLVKKK